MKIKIIRREIFHNGCWYTCYDTYQGFVGMPSTFPFMTKWVEDKVGLSEEELAKYLLSFVTIIGNVKIITKEHKNNKNG